MNLLTLTASLLSNKHNQSPNCPNSFSFLTMSCECSLCYTQLDVDFVTYPCCNQSFCGVCEDKLVNKCPFCRQQVTDTFQHEDIRHQLVHGALQTMCGQEIQGGVIAREAHHEQCIDCKNVQIHELTREKDAHVIAHANSKEVQAEVEDELVYSWARFDGMVRRYNDRCELYLQLNSAFTVVRNKLQKEITRQRRAKVKRQKHAVTTIRTRKQVYFR